MRKRILSSTNYKLPCSKPANQNCFDLNINLLKTSKTMVKRKGDSGSLCLKPLDALNQPLGPPFINTKLVVNKPSQI